MLPVVNADLDLTSRKDTKMMVLELCTNIYATSLQANIRRSYVALLESYVYDSPVNQHRVDFPSPRYSIPIVMQQATTNQQ